MSRPKNNTDRVMFRDVEITRYRGLDYIHRDGRKRLGYEIYFKYLHGTREESYRTHLVFENRAQAYGFAKSLTADRSVVGVPHD